MDNLDRIQRRQVARFLDHLSRAGRLTPELEADVKRAYGYVFQDVRESVGQQKHGHDKETGNVPHQPLG